MPLDPHLYTLYLGAAVALILAPGPDSFLVLSRGLFQGRRAGFVTLSGTLAGNVAHACLAAVGVSALIAASPALFEGLRYAGAAYLVFLGAQSLRGAWRGYREHRAGKVTPPKPLEPWRNFVHAFLTNLLNPKVVLFYLAFVPQFVAPGLGHVGLQSLLLGLTLAALSTVYHAGLVLLAHGAARRVLQSPGFRAALDGFAGLVFLGFALRLFLTERKFA